MPKIVSNINPYSFTTSAFVVGLLLIQDLTVQEQNSIGNWLQLVGLTMQTYSSQYSISDKSNKDSSLEDDVALLKKTIKSIEKELEAIYKNC